MVVTATAAEQQNKNDDQPDAGTVVVKAHFVTSLVLLCAIVCPKCIGCILSDGKRGKEIEKGTK